MEAKAEARREEEQNLTFGALAQRYVSQYAAHKRTGAEDARILKHDVLPRWGKLKAKAIRKRDVVVLLDKILEHPGQPDLRLRAQGVQLGSTERPGRG